MVCVAALPPMDATIGIRMASATRCWMVPEKRLITDDARKAVARFTISQTERVRTV